MMDDKKKTPDFKFSEVVLNGETADIYFAHTLTILRVENINPTAVMELFPGRAGILCGMEEVKALLQKVLAKVECEVWALNEGDTMDARKLSPQLNGRIHKPG